MIIQLSDLLAKSGRKKEINLSFDFEPTYFEGDLIKAAKPVEVVGSVNSTEDLLMLTANINTELELSCSRCLETFIYPIDIDIEERFTNNKELINDEEIIFVDDDMLDITSIISNSIISTLPIKRLCKGDCQGLCSQCGNNNNVKECQCIDTEIDIRFAKLQELFGE